MPFEKRRKLSVTPSSAKRSTALALLLLSALLPVSAESGGPTLLPNSRLPAVFVDFGFSYLFPLGRFGDVAPPAPGPTMELRLPLRSYPKIEGGVLFGFVALEGREPGIDGGSLTPILGILRFSLLEDPWFHLQAVGGLGAAHTSLDYARDSFGGPEPDVDIDEGSATHPASLIGLEYRITLGRLLSLSAGWGFLMVFESALPLGSFYAPLALGIGL